MLHDYILKGKTDGGWDMPEWACLFPERKFEKFECYERAKDLNPEVETFYLVEIYF